MTLLDILIPVSIILFIILLVWSRVQQQKMIDTVVELKQIISNVFGTTEEVVKG